MSTRKKAWMLAGLTALCAASFSAHAEQLVVAESRGVGMAPGSVVDSTKPLELKGGQHVTLISQSGVTIKIDGPSSVAPDAVAKSGGVGLGTKLAALAAGNQRVGEVGTTRGRQAAKLPSPWVLDVSRSGTVCMKEGDTPVLWRPATKGDTKLAIAPSDLSWRAEFTWPAGTENLAMGPGLPLHGGTTYLVSAEGDQFAVTVDTVPSALPTNEMQAAWMAERGCQSQAEAMVQAQK